MISWWMGRSSCLDVQWFHTSFMTYTFKKPLRLLYWVPIHFWSHFRKGSSLGKHAGSSRLTSYRSVYTVMSVWGCTQKFLGWVIMKYMPTFGITHCCPLQRVTVAKLTRLTEKVAIQLHLVAESCTICSSCSKWPVQKLLDTHSYTPSYSLHPWLIIA
jgi:hypothetical protein